MAIVITACLAGASPVPGPIAVWRGRRRLPYQSDRLRISKIGPFLPRPAGYGPDARAAAGAAALGHRSRTPEPARPARRAAAVHPGAHARRPLRHRARRVRQRRSEAGAPALSGPRRGDHHPDGPRHRRGVRGAQAGRRAHRHDGRRADRHERGEPNARRDRGGSRRAFRRARADRSGAGRRPSPRRATSSASG